MEEISWKTMAVIITIAAIAGLAIVWVADGAEAAVSDGVLNGNSHLQVTGLVGSREFWLCDSTLTFRQCTGGAGTTTSTEPVGIANLDVAPSTTVSVTWYSVATSVGLPAPENVRLFAGFVSSSLQTIGGTTLWDNPPPANGTVFQFTTTQEGGMIGLFITVRRTTLGTEYTCHNTPITGSPDFPPTGGFCTSQHFGIYRRPFSNSNVDIVQVDHAGCGASSATPCPYGTSSDNRLRVRALSHVTSHPIDLTLCVKTERTSACVGQEVVNKPSAQNTATAHIAINENNFASSNDDWYGSVVLPSTVFSAAGTESWRKDRHYVYDSSLATYVDEATIATNNRVWVDPRLSPSSDGTSNDNSFNAVHQVYNRGESVTLDGYILNALDEQLTRNLGFRIRDTQGSVTEATFGSVSGPNYQFTYTVQNTHLAANDTSGRNKHIQVYNIVGNNNLNTLPTHAVSSFYRTDCHPQLTATLKQDSIFTPDANEDHTYVISADLLNFWVHVTNVRGDTPIDTVNNAIRIRFANPDGIVNTDYDEETGADGWSNGGVAFSPIPPSGIWEMRCTLKTPIDGNIGHDVEEVSFVAAFTENLVKRTYVDGEIKVNDTHTFFLHVEKNDGPKTPDTVPKIEITFINQSVSPWSFEVIVPLSDMYNAVDHTQSVNGALYYYNWTPDRTGIYNVWFRSTIEGAAIRSSDTTNVLRTASVDGAMVEIGGLPLGDALELGLWLALGLWSLWHGWALPASAAFIAMPRPLFENAGSDYPMNFALGVFLFAVFIWVQALVNRRQKLRSE